jgi:hypothetical protein
MLGRRYFAIFVCRPGMGLTARASARKIASRTYMGRAAAFPSKVPGH